MVEERRHVAEPDPPEVEPFREADEVAGEAIAPDVRALPDPFGIGLVAEGVVQRAAVPRAAAVALSVRADREHRLVHRLAAIGAEEVEADQLLVHVEVEAVDALLRL